MALSTIPSTMFTAVSMWYLMDIGLSTECIKLIKPTYITCISTLLSPTFHSVLL